MYLSESGTVFIGFTPKIKCKKCSNTIEMLLRQEYLKDKTLFSGWDISFHHVHCVCSICEFSEHIASPKTLFRRSNVSSLHKLLMDALDKNKVWFKSLPESQSDKILERYFSLEAFDFMRALLK
jgi:hypothetical protein